MKTLRSLFASCLLMCLCATQASYPIALAYAAEDEMAATQSEEANVVQSDAGEGETDTDTEEENASQNEAHDEEEADATSNQQEDAEDQQEETVNEGNESDETASGGAIEDETEEKGNETADETMAKSSTTPSDELEEHDLGVMAQATGDDEAALDTHEATTSVHTAVKAQEATTTLQEATTTTATTSDADTTSIVSGQSIALANILNMVNSNFVNSEGVVLFSNFFDTVAGAIDFRQYFGPLASYGCSLIACQGSDVAVHIDNNASIDNDIVVSAVSGNNEIDGAHNAVIETGDAYAGLNLINVANTNLVDSNYLLVTLNAFKGVNGDIVFPSLSQFFSTLARGASTPQVIDIENTAGVNNSIAVDANAGDNAVQHNGSSTIATGNAVGSTNVFNQLNSSLVGGESVAIVFRVHGSWAGEIFGAPDDLGWTVGEDGSIYLFDVGGQSHNGSLSMYGTSTAQINNNVSVVALTGQNEISNAETAVISTGNAYAGANVINVANANVIGRNWILAVINIFGDFNGNIAFGRPDLWIGGQIDVPKSVENGSELNYTFTVINNGDSAASGVTLDTEFDGSYLELTDASHTYEQEGNNLHFALGSLPPLGAVEVAYSARIKDAPQGTAITNVAEVDSHETDNNTDDNIEILTVRTDEEREDSVRIELRQSNNSAAAEIAAVVPVSLEASRLTPHMVMNVSNNTAEQKLVITNATDAQAHHVVLHDVLRDPSGTIIQDEVWELGDVQPGEKIELGYAITFNPNAAYGKYTLHTYIEGSNIPAVAKDNGSIAYTQITELDSLLSASLALSQTSLETIEPEAEEQEKSDVVYHGEETPLIPAFAAQVAHASENGQLASALASGIALDPIIAFFIATTAFLLFALLRLFRIVK